MRFLPLAVLSLLAPLASQDDSEDWRLPFRHPNQQIAPPEDVWRELRTMHARAHEPRVRAWFDANGVEICDDDAWRAARDRLLGLRLDGGYLSQIIRQSASAEDRALAFYGMFYNQDHGLVMQMLNHIPGEPLRELREEGFRRAIEFLRVHLAKQNPGDLDAWSKIRVGPAGQKPPKPGEWSHAFDAVPYFVLLTVDSPLDQQQALWFLAEVVKIRPDLWRDYLHAAAPALYPLVVHDDRKVRERAVEFASLLDPKHREPPSIDASMAALKSWLDAIFYDVFPPIRPIAPGLTELYASDDLNKIIEVGGELLRNGSLGDPDSGKLHDGTPYRGLRIARMPAPLDKLGLEIGQVVTAINGAPIPSCVEALRILEKSTWQRSFMVEFVAGGRLHAKEFRRRD